MFFGGRLRGPDGDAVDENEIERTMFDDLFDRIHFLLLFEHFFVKAWKESDTSKRAILS